MKNVQAKSVQSTITDWLDGPATYPTHPLVVAVSIMLAFQSLEDASAVDVGGSYCRALGSSEVLGCGMHANCGLDLLRRVAKGASLEDAIAFANEFWINGQAGGHSKSVAPGLKEAERIQRRFLELCGKWNFDTVVA